MNELYKEVFKKEEGQERQTQPVTLRLTPSEAEAVAFQAEKEGIPFMATWIRKQILKLLPKVK